MVGNNIVTLRWSITNDSKSCIMSIIIGFLIDLVTGKSSLLLGSRRCSPTSHPIIHRGHMGGFVLLFWVVQLLELCNMLSFQIMNIYNYQPNNMDINFLSHWLKSDDDDASQSSPCFPCLFSIMGIVSESLHDHPRADGHMTYVWRPSPT